MPRISSRTKYTTLVVAILLATSAFVLVLYKIGSSLVDEMGESFAATSPSDFRRQPQSDLAREHGITSVRDTHRVLRDDPDVLVQLAVSENDHERGWAITALGMAKDPKYYPIFLTALSDPDRYVRMDAAFSVGALPPTREICADLERLRAAEQDESVAAMIGEAIAHLGCQALSGTP